MVEKRHTPDSGTWFLADELKRADGTLPSSADRTSVSANLGEMPPCRFNPSGDGSSRARRQTPRRPGAPIKRAASGSREVHAEFR